MKTEKGSAHLALLLTFIALVAITYYFIKATLPQNITAQTPPKPNIILLISDDQATPDYDIAMTKTKSLFDSNGTRFTNAFFNSDLCCPDRATFFTGQLPHNTGVWGNNAPEGGYSVFKHNTGLAVSLHNAGYTTANFGK